MAKCLNGSCVLQKSINYRACISIKPSLVHTCTFYTAGQGRTIRVLRGLKLEFHMIATFLLWMGTPDHPPWGGVGSRQGEDDQGFSTKTAATVTLNQTSRGRQINEP